MAQHTLTPPQLLTRWYLSHHHLQHRWGSVSVVFTDHNSSTWQFLAHFRVRISFHCPGIGSGANKQKKVLKAKTLECTSSQARDCFREQTRNRRSHCRFLFPLVMKGGLLLNSSFSRPITRRQCHQTTEPTSPRSSLGRIQRLKIRLPMGEITIRGNWYSTRDSTESSQYSPHRLFFVVAFEAAVEFCSVTIFIRFARDRNLSHTL